MMNERLEKLMKMHAADPADPFCPYALALEFAKSGDAVQALHWLDKAVAIDANYAYAYYQKGRLLSQSGQIPAAREVLRTGLSAARRSGASDAAKAASEISQLLESLG